MLDIFKGCFIGVLFTSLEPNFDLRVIDSMFSSSSFESVMVFSLLYDLDVL